MKSVQRLDRESVKDKQTDRVIFIYNVSMDLITD